MADPEQLEVLAKGVRAWNEWRSDNPRLSVDLTNVNLRNAGLTGFDFNDAGLRGTNLQGAILTDARLRFADLIGVDFRRAKLIRADLFKGQLRDANLSEADLADANLARSNLVGADLEGASLIGTNFHRAAARDANLSSAYLLDAIFHGANLRNANLSRADLTRARISTADLSGTDLFCARLSSTIFADVDLSSVKHLDSIQHLTPSTIGIDTLYRSKGSIPEVFLRGAGVPESLISYAKGLIGSAIEYYSLFISYSTADQDFAERLHADLQAKGIRCWFAPHDIKGGRKILEQIDEAIRLYDKLLLILSPNSMESDWVKTEISKARKREVRDKARVLFPVRLVPFEVLRDWECFDADSGKDSAREIREYFIPDFSNWKDHDSYLLAFDRLVKDLQAPAANA